MKIQGSVRAAFDAQFGLNEALKKHVDSTMSALKQPRWHYEARLKELESFAVKLETCRVPKPAALEDFLACTIVVPTTADISTAIGAVRKKFTVKYRRPAKPKMTSKAANAFPFDDVRLYCCRGNDGTTPADPINELIFEVQVKTFLQHAWSIATHDFNYKTDGVTWGKDRVVAHLKAALEHVELSLQEAAALAVSPLVDLGNPQYELVAEVIAVLKKHWKGADLPFNVRAVAESVAALLTASKIKPPELDAILVSQKKLSGALPLNLSPYGVIVSALAGVKTAELDAALVASKRPILLITPELALPTGFPSKDATSAVVTV
ncbi:hypothetical protein [Devosia sp. CN2-171]|uniref:hypothetical protein n=1 Tax=Devosia sp. CN2-171 TaxID=3400909 RepID=UPI003BF83556